MGIVKFLMMAAFLYVLYKVFNGVLKKIGNSVHTERDSSNDQNNQNKVSQQSLIVCDNCGVHYPSSQMIQKNDSQICKDCS